MANFYTDNDDKYKSIYQTIARSVFRNGNNRVLTFHYRSIATHESKSNVEDFVTPENIALFKKEFQIVLESEFPQLKNKYSMNRLTITGLTCQTKNRIDILQEFEDTPDQASAVVDFKRDMESKMPYVEGFVVKECSRIASNWRSNKTLHEYLKENNIMGIEGVDTRALTKHIRLEGAMKAVLSSKDKDNG